jgi:TonB family protein
MLYCLTAQDCVAQTVAVEKPCQSYSGISNDVQYYRIVYYETKEDYVIYNKLVRERIKQSLLSAYRRFYKGGDVNLLFIINADGKLAKFDVDYKESSTDRKLIDLAVSSLKKSSPFPPFPERLSDPQLPFSVTISFKEK